jgi:hypothetical protein
VTNASCYHRRMRLSLRVLLPAIALVSACTGQVDSTEDMPAQAVSSSAKSVASMASQASAPTTIPVSDLEQAYVHKIDRYSISFPAGWTVKEKAASPLTYRKSSGTSFITPEGYHSETTLIGALVFIERTRKPCVQFVNAMDVTLAGRQMQKGDSTAIGTKYYTRNTMYTISTDSACYSIMLTVKACTAGDECGDEHLNTFDPSELNKTFERMVMSFKPL